MWPAKKTAWNGPTPTMVQCNFQCVCVRQSYFRIVLGLLQSNSPQMFLICQTHIISNYWKHLFWLPRAVLCGILCNRSCGCSKRIGSKSLLKASKKKKKSPAVRLSWPKKRKRSSQKYSPSRRIERREKARRWRWRDEDAWMETDEAIWWVESDTGRDSSFLIRWQWNQDQYVNIYRQNHFKYNHLFSYFGDWI